MNINNLTDDIDINIYNIYLELDTILDTRHTTLYSMSPDIADKVIANKTYTNRVKDSFELITNKIFKLVYATRDKLHLLTASQTFIPEILTVTALKLSEEKRLKNTGNGSIDVYLNCYPYELQETEINTLQALVKTMAVDSNVVVINKPPTEITPKWVRDHVGYVIMYDGISWVNYHLSTGDFLKSNLTNTTLLTPIILGEGLPASKIDEALIDDIITKLKPLINLEYVRAKFFSMNILEPDDIKK